MKDHECKENVSRKLIIWPRIHSTIQKKKKYTHKIYNRKVKIKISM